MAVRTARCHLPVSCSQLAKGTFLLRLPGSLLRACSVMERTPRDRGRRRGFTAKAAAAAADAAVHNSALPNSQIMPAGSTNSRTTSTTLSHLTEHLFAQLNVSADTKRAIAEVMRYDRCTSVQADAIPAMLTGADIVCKAKTGTGKTLAFLIPAIEALIRAPVPRGSIGVLVLSPARELALQIEAEAKQLTRFQNLKTQAIVGGTSMHRDLQALKRAAPDVLIATPGRLNDHLQNEGLAGAMQHLRLLVFDEADRLLDMGFRRDIDKTLEMLPPKHTRQTVLFSATFPQDTSALCQYALRSNFTFVDTVGDDTVDTNKQVEQRYAVTPLAEQLGALHHTIQQHQAEEPDHKIMVFFVTANQTAFAAELFSRAGTEVLEMHSRKSQAHRTRTADAFRGARQGIMFSSDVSARGVDYPDVTLVVQVGVPSDKAQYVHRVGRTARAGKTGHGVLLLADFEAFFVRQLSGLPVEPLQLPNTSAHRRHLDSLLPRVSETTKAKAYSAFLGFYNSQKGVRWTKEQLVQEANYYSQLLGCPEPPALLAKTVGMMGLRGTPGLTVIRGSPGQPPRSPRPFLGPAPPHAQEPRGQAQAGVGTGAAQEAQQQPRPGRQHRAPREAPQQPWLQQRPGQQQQPQQQQRRHSSQAGGHELQAQEQRGADDPWLLGEAPSHAAPSGMPHNFGRGGVKADGGISFETSAAPKGQSVNKGNRSSRRR